MFVVGGMDIVTYDHIDWFSKFNIQTLKWEQGPELNHKRFKPGTLITKDTKYIYAFGGCDENSIERMNLTE